MAARIAFAFALVMSAPGAAQPEVDKRLRLIVGEAGLARDVDHAAMLHAFDRLAARVGDYDLALSDHIPWWDRGYPPNRPWIAHLTTACDQPEAWPRRLDWHGAHQHLCFAAVRRVRDHLKGKLADPCKGKPDQWRARGKPSRKARRKWAQIGCRSVDGRRTKQNFFDTRRPNDRRNKVPRRRRHQRGRDQHVQRVQAADLGLPELTRPRGTRARAG